MDFIQSVLTNQNTIPILFFLILLIFVVFLIVEANRNRRHREDVMRDLVKTQEKLFTDAAELLSEKLVEYTSGVLTEKVNESYLKLVSEDLLPSVNDAARVITELSEAVTRRQEAGMEALAERLGELLTSKTRNYIQEEALMIDALQEGTKAFADRLTGITLLIEQMSVRYSTAYEQANSVSTTISASVAGLSGKMEELGLLLQNAASTVGKTQDAILDSGKTATLLSESAEEMGRQMREAAALSASQTEKTAELLKDAVTTMQQNTSLAAKTVLDEFSINLNTAGTAITSAVEQMKEISEAIQISASQFANGLSESYQRLGSGFTEQLSQVTSSISESASQEYQKVILSAEQYSGQFAESIERLNTSFEGHITNLQTIAQQLNHNISSFSSDVDMSSTRFELGMEKSVSAALREMDSALADIVRRLVTVTQSIQEAADALPKAVKSIQELN